MIENIKMLENIKIYLILIIIFPQIMLNFLFLLMYFKLNYYQKNKLKIK